MFHKRQQEGEVQSKAPMKVAKRHDKIAAEPMACDHCPYRPHHPPIMSVQIVTEIERKNFPNGRSYRPY